MEIVIDTGAAAPVFAQLIAQIKQAVLDGQLRPGAALPSIRQLANDLGLNHNTVAKAYRLLERDSVIQTQGYRGTIIHPDAKANCATDLNDSIQSTLTAAVKTLRAAGATDSEIRIAFARVMNNRTQ